MPNEDEFVSEQREEHEQRLLERGLRADALVLAHGDVRDQRERASACCPSTSPLNTSSARPAEEAKADAAGARGSDGEIEDGRARGTGPDARPVQSGSGSTVQEERHERVNTIQPRGSRFMRCASGDDVVRMKRRVTSPERRCDVAEEGLGSWVLTSRLVARSHRRDAAGCARRAVHQRRGLSLSVQRGAVRARAWPAPASDRHLRSCFSPASASSCGLLPTRHDELSAVRCSSRVGDAEVVHRGRRLGLG